MDSVFPQLITQELSRLADFVMVMVIWSLTFAYALHPSLLAGLESCDRPSSTSIVCVTQLSLDSTRAILLIGWQIH